MNTIGKIFRLTSFGESHGIALGGVIDGMPAGVQVDYELLHSEMQRRKPAQNHVFSQRKEEDEVEILSGIFEGKTLGTPIAFIVRNTDAHPQDYSNIKDLFRPSHADYTYSVKYGIRDYRGGGRASARETLSRVVAGAFAKMVLRDKGISISAYTSQIGNITLDKDYSKYNLTNLKSDNLYCPDAEKAESMYQLIETVRAEGNTLGGCVSCVIKGCPVGVGEPVFDKLQSCLAQAMMSINAAKGFEYGDGFSMASMRGSKANDAFINKNHKIATLTNHSGGIQGGISNGEDIFFRVAFKPVPTLLQEQSTIDTEGNPIILYASGRHDTCVVPRAVVIVESMAAIILLDLILRRASYKG